MADQYYWVGTVGPFKYDDATPVNDVNLVYDGLVAPDASPIVSTGQIQIATAPTVGTHVLREDDIGGIVGDVVGPGSSTDNAAARFDSTSGKLLQDSAFIVDDSGHVTSFGGQIAFPAAQVASADVNVLDDYQEGTFTPTLTGSVVPTYTGGTLLGRYVKIGNHVFASVWITGVTITGSGGGQARIGGFPFSAAATNVHTSSVDVATAAAFSVLPTALYMRGGAAVASLIDVALTAPTWNVVAGVNVCFQVFYMI